MFQRYLRDAHTVRFLVPLLFTELPAFNPQQACPDNSQSFIPGGKGDRWVTFPAPTTAGVIPEGKKVANWLFLFLSSVWLEPFGFGFQSLQDFTEDFLVGVFSTSLPSKHFCFWSDLIVICWSTFFFFFYLLLPIWKKRIFHSPPTRFETAALTTLQTQTEWLRISISCSGRSERKRWPAKIWC